MKWHKQDTGQKSGAALSSYLTFAAKLTEGEKAEKGENTENGENTEKKKTGKEPGMIGVKQLPGISAAGMVRKPQGKDRIRIFAGECGSLMVCRAAYL